MFQILKGQTCHFIVKTDWYLKTCLHFLKIYLFYFMCLSVCFQGYLSTTCLVPMEKSVVLGLELQMGAGIWTPVLCKNSKCSDLLVHPCSRWRPAFCLWLLKVLPLSYYKAIVHCKNIERNPLKPNLRMACHFLWHDSYHRVWVFLLIFYSPRMVFFSRRVTKSEGLSVKNLVAWRWGMDLVLGVSCSWNLRKEFCGSWG